MPEEINRWNLLLDNGDSAEINDIGSKGEPRTLEISYIGSDGVNACSDQTEVVFEDPAEAEKRPRLLVSLDSVMALKSLCEHEYARFDSIHEALRECRISYFKEIQYLRDELNRKWNVEDVTRSYEVYWFDPPRYVDADLEEFLKECIRMTNQKLIQENHELHQKLAMLGGLQGGELLSTLRLLMKDNQPSAILAQIYALCKTKEQKDDFANAVQLLVPSKTQVVEKIVYVENESDAALLAELEELRKDAAVGSEFKKEMRELRKKIDESEKLQKDAEGRAERAEGRADFLTERAQKAEQSLMEAQVKLKAIGDMGQDQVQMRKRIAALEEGRSQIAKRLADRVTGFADKVNELIVALDGPGAAAMANSKPPPKKSEDENENAFMMVDHSLECLSSLLAGLDKAVKGASGGGSKDMEDLARRHKLEMDKLQAELKAVKAQLEEASGTTREVIVSGDDEDLAKLRKQLAASKEANEKLKEDNASKDKRMKSLEQKLAQAELTAGDLAAKVEVLRDRVKELKAELKALKIETGRYQEGESDDESEDEEDVPDFLMKYGKWVMIQIAKGKPRWQILAEHAHLAEMKRTWLLQQANITYEAAPPQHVAMAGDRGSVQTPQLSEEQVRSAYAFINAKDAANKRHGSPSAQRHGSPPGRAQRASNAVQPGVQKSSSRRHQSYDTSPEAMRRYAEQMQQGQRTSILESREPRAGGQSPQGRGRQLVPGSMGAPQAGWAGEGYQPSLSAAATSSGAFRESPAQEFRQPRSNTASGALQHDSHRGYAEPAGYYTPQREARSVSAEKESGVNPGGCPAGGGRIRRQGHLAFPRPVEESRKIFESSRSLTPTEQRSRSRGSPPPPPVAQAMKTLAELVERVPNPPPSKSGSVASPSNCAVSIVSMPAGVASISPGAQRGRRIDVLREVREELVVAGASRAAAVAELSAPKGRQAGRGRSPAPAALPVVVENDLAQARAEVVAPSTEGKSSMLPSDSSGLNSATGRLPDVTQEAEQIRPQSMSPARTAPTDSERGKAPPASASVRVDTPDRRGSRGSSRGGSCEGTNHHFAGRMSPSGPCMPLRPVSTPELPLRGRMSAPEFPVRGLSPIRNESNSRTRKPADTPTRIPEKSENVAATANLSSQGVVKTTSREVHDAAVPSNESGKVRKLLVDGITPDSDVIETASKLGVALPDSSGSVGSMVPPFCDGSPGSPPGEASGTPASPTSLSVFTHATASIAGPWESVQLPRRQLAPSGVPARSARPAPPPMGSPKSPVPGPPGVAPIGSGPTPAPNPPTMRGALRGASTLGGGGGAYGGPLSASMASTDASMRSANPNSSRPAASTPPGPPRVGAAPLSKRMLVVNEGRDKKDSTGTGWLSVSRSATQLPLTNGRNSDKVSQTMRRSRSAAGSSGSADAEGHLPETLPPLPAGRSRRAPPGPGFAGPLPWTVAA